MGCGSAFAKYLLFVFNFVFFLSGIGVLTLGSYMKANEDDYVGLIGTNLFTVCILLIVVGILVTIIGFFGCCGAIRESKCMLYTYAGLLCLIFVMEFAGGIAAFVYRDDLKGQATSNLNQSMYSYPNSPDIKKQWDEMQQDVGCCGTYNYSDWSKILATSPTKTSPVPASCCYKNDDSCDSTSSETYNFMSGHMWSGGCVDATVQTIDDDAVIIGGVAIGIAFIQILGIVFACCLASAIKD